LSTIYLKTIYLKTIYLKTIYLKILPQGSLYSNFIFRRFLMKKQKKLGFLALIGFVAVASLFTVCKVTGSGNSIAAEPIVGGNAVDGYQMGDTGPAGGRIFYDRGAGYPGGSGDSEWRYLEAAPVNSPTPLAWVISNSYYQDVGANGAAIGTGRANTLAITGALAQANAPAAWYADTYTVTNGGTEYDDWFLPGVDELSELRRHKNICGITWDSGQEIEEKLSGVFWSSSQSPFLDNDEYPATPEREAMAVLFDAEENSEIMSGPGTKKIALWVRPVRAF
jgi:hypothetical protein